jgi:Antidote-toxin recognition MazE, bacterial antitoxin
MLTNDNLNKKKEIIRTWITGHNSCTLIIPREFAREYGLDEPSDVVVERKPEGILIRKIEV